MVCVYNMKADRLPRGMVRPAVEVCANRSVFFDSAQKRTDSCLKFVKCNVKNYHKVSRPLLRLMYREYWFRLSRLSMMVIGSFASYTKTKSVESAV
jgi:hypothetical protein